jgi:MSHA pilin protein MshD
LSCSACSGRRLARGFSLVDAVVFIVVVGIGVAGIAVLFNQMTRGSVDPGVRKQALAIASSLMEEIQLRGFTLCDPDDPNVYTAPGTPCTAVEVIGPEAGESRYANPRFDNVSDYHGFAMAGVAMSDATGTALPDLASYSASVTVAQPNPGDLPGIPFDAQLRIVVTVTGPANVNVSLQGYRTRYAPNTP